MGTRRPSSELEKENGAPRRKMPRKSVGGDKRVSFGSVSMHMYEKVDSSPTPAQGAARRASLQQAGLEARQAESGLNGRAPDTPPPPPPLSPGPEQQPSQARVQGEAQAQPEAGPSAHASPPVSEASELFFSPSESIPGSPAPAPRLSTLLREDERADEGVPALSALLHQDEADETMDVTMAVGGIKAAAAHCAAAAAAAASPDAPPPPPPPAADEDEPEMDLTCALGGITGATQMSTVEEDPEAEAAEAEAEMDLTCAVGSIKLTSSRRRSSLSEACGLEEQPPLRQPPEPAERRRFSFHGVLASVGQRLSRLASSTQVDEAEPSSQESQEPVPEEEEEPPADAQPSSEEPLAEEAGASTPAAAVEEERGAPSSAGASEPQAVMTFEAYLARAGVHFTLESTGSGKGERRATSIGTSKAPGLLSGGDAGSLAAQMLTTCIFQPKLEQLHWAVQQLNSGHSAMQAEFAKMEEYIQTESPTFFNEPPVSEIPAPQIKKLKARCRQAARVFWYDWRAKLESATGKSLGAALAGLDKDLEALQQQGRDLEQLKQHVAEGVQSAEEHVGQLSEHLRSTQQQLAQREPAFNLAEQKKAALQAELLQAEAEFARLENHQRTQQARLQQLTASLSELQAPAAGAGHDPAALQGDDLLEALHAASAWRASALSSSRIVLRFREHFELAAALDPRRAAVSALELTSRLRPEAGAPPGGAPPGGAAHTALLAALFPSVHAELQPLLAECVSSRQLPALVQACSLRLGRLLDLADEVRALEARMRPSVAALPMGGACVTLHFSFFQTRAKFSVALSLHSDDPQQPLTWQLRPWEGAPAALAPAGGEAAAPAPEMMVDAALLQRTVADACEPHTSGYGRLGLICDAIHARFQSVAQFG